MTQEELKDIIQTHWQNIDLYLSTVSAKQVDDMIEAIGNSTFARTELVSIVLPNWYKALRQKQIMHHCLTEHKGCDIQTVLYKAHILKLLNEVAEQENKLSKLKQALEHESNRMTCANCRNK